MREDHTFSRDREFLPDKHYPQVKRIRIIRIYHIHLGMNSKRLKNMRDEKILQVVVPG